VETALQKVYEDAESEQELRDSLSQVDKKWSSLHVWVKDYRDALTKRSTFAKLYEEVDYWIQQKNQIINRIVTTKNECKELKEVEFVLSQINQNIDEVQQYNEGKVKHLSQLAVEINGIIKIISIKYLKRKIKHIIYIY
jgi:uncharacterized coiled-coil DUF342 family protein